MELLGVKICGIRNIKSNYIKFGRNITSLVSTNNYGKSNLIQAFDFLLLFIHASPAMKSVMMSDKYFIPLNKETALQNFFAELQFSTDLSGKNCFIRYTIEFEWSKNNKSLNAGKRIIGEQLCIKFTGDRKKYSNLINRHETAKYKASQSGRCDKQIKVKDNELVINKLSLEDRLYWHSIIEVLNSIDMYIARHFDARSMYIPNFLIPKKQEDFDITTLNDVPRILYKLQEQHNDEYMLLLNAFGQLFPNLNIAVGVLKLDEKTSDNPQLPDDIPYNISDSIYYILVKDINLNQPVDFNMLSDGTKRLFAMLLYAVRACSSGLSVIAIEEPENSIHPALLKDFLDILSQFAGNCKVILTSHSPYILQYVKMEDVYIGRPNEKGLASFSRIADNKQKKLIRDIRKEGCDFGSYIFELLSGGDSDIELLNSYLEDEAN